jgi:hypothetical protein
MINPNQASTDPEPAYNKNKTLVIQNLIRSDPLPARSKDLKKTLHQTVKAQYKSHQKKNRNSKKTTTPP